MQLIDAINESLQHHIPSNATFLAERLLAEKDNEETRSLLADCYFAENKHYKVFHVLKEAKSESNRYKFAVSCSKINKYKEAEKALLGADFGKGKNYDNVANGSYGFYLLGVVCEKQTRYADAKDFFMRALEINPTLWSAYERIGRLGDHVNPGKIFSEVKLKAYETTQAKKMATPVSAKKKKEDEDKVRRLGNQGGSTFPKRKNSMHSTDSGSTSLFIKVLWDS